MNTPAIYTVNEIYNSDTIVRDTNLPARPLGYQGLFIFKRIKAAYYVFIGKYDALNWED